MKHIMRTGTMAVFAAALGIASACEASADALWRQAPERMALDAKSHGPKVPPDLLPERLEELTVSAWVKPSSFTTYNELFRIESGTGRVLFSFQEHGKFISFGLHGNSYAECDGPIDPAKVADGKWHHVAASFGGGVFSPGAFASERGRMLSTMSCGSFSSRTEIRPLTSRAALSLT